MLLRNGLLMPVNLGNNFVDYWSMLVKCFHHSIIPQGYRTRAAETFPHPTKPTFTRSIIDLRNFQESQMVVTPILFIAGF